MRNENVVCYLFHETFAFYLRRKGVTEDRHSHLKPKFYMHHLLWLHCEIIKNIKAIQGEPYQPLIPSTEAFGKWLKFMLSTDLRPQISPVVALAVPMGVSSVVLMLQVAVQTGSLPCSTRTAESCSTNIASHNCSSDRQTAMCCMWPCKLKHWHCSLQFRQMVCLVPHMALWAAALMLQDAAPFRQSATCCMWPCNLQSWHCRLDRQPGHVPFMALRAAALTSQVAVQTGSRPCAGGIFTQGQCRLSTNKIWMTRARMSSIT